MPFRMVLEFPPPGLQWMKCQVRRALLILLLNSAFNNTHPGRRADICLTNIASFPEKKLILDLVSDSGELNNRSRYGREVIISPLPLQGPVTKREMRQRLGLPETFYADKSFHAVSVYVCFTHGTSMPPRKEP